MLGLIRPDEGRVSMMGMGIERASDIQQQVRLHPGAQLAADGYRRRDLVVHMGELRGLPRQVAVLRASEVLFQVGLKEERSRLIRTFSVGMRRRTIWLARSAPRRDGDPGRAHEQPRSGRPRDMLTLVRRLSADLGIAVIMSSHVLEDVVRACDSVLVLRDGKIIATRAVRAQANRRPTARCRCRSWATPTRSPQPPPLGAGRAPDGEWLLVQGDDADAVLRGVRDAAIASGAGLPRLFAPAGPAIEQSLIGAIG